MQQSSSQPDEVMTVGLAAKRAGVTVRALHHWDQIGLVVPSRSPKGHRHYVQSDLDRIRRIVSYQRAGLDLAAIRELLERPSDQIVTTIAEQRRIVAAQLDQLHELDAQLQRIQSAHQTGILLSPSEQRASFGPHWDPTQSAIAREQWGDSSQWTQFAEGAASRSDQQWRELAEGLLGLEQQFVAALDEHEPPDGAIALDLVERHRALFSQLFPISRQMQVCLGQMFVGDPRFAAHYDRLRPGLAQWLHLAIDASARAHGIDPEKATWTQSG